MRIGSIGNTNFGLTITPDMLDLLDKSASKIADKKGKKAASRFKRNVTLLKNSVPDDYTLYAKNYSNIGIKYPIHVMLKIPNGCNFIIKKLESNGILSTTAVNDIKKQVIKQKKTDDNPNTLRVFF